MRRTVKRIPVVIPVGLGSSRRVYDRPGVAVFVDGSESLTVGIAQQMGQRKSHTRQHVRRKHTCDRPPSDASHEIIIFPLAHALIVNGTMSRDPDVQMVRNAQVLR